MIEPSEKWNGLRFRRVHGDAMSVNMDAIVHQMQRICKVTENYCPRNTLNADELDVFYKQPLSWTLSNGQDFSQKKNKMCLTFPVCRNAGGTDKMPLMIIGEAERPRAFINMLGL